MSDDVKMIQWSLSLPPRAQYAKGDMLNIKAETVEELESMLDSVLNGEVLDKATSVGSLLMQAFIVAEGITPAAVGSSNASDATVTQDSAPAGGGKFCEHGKRDERSGTGKKGPWTGYFCPSKKCDVVWG